MRKDIQHRTVDAPLCAVFSFVQMSGRKKAHKLKKICGTLARVTVTPGRTNGALPVSQDRQRHFADQPGVPRVSET